jgi:hypothetical protein
MKNLTQFSPAETLLLLEGKNAALKDLLKVTLLDLFLKQALQTQEIIRPSTTQSLPVSNTYVVKGDAIGYHKALEHEYVFLKPFYKNDDSQILFNNLVKIGYQNATTEKRYRHSILKNRNLDRLFEQGLRTVFKGRLMHTALGQQVKADILAEIREMESALPAAMETDKDRALDLMRQLGGNIFLIKGVDLKLMREIENHAVLEDSRGKNYASHNSSSSDILMWIALDSHSHHFDNSYSHHDWDPASDGNLDSDGGDSGGDSGCSGCGGCGGD